MQYLKNYLNKIIAQGNEKLAESISHTAEEVGNKYIKNFSFTSHEIGLLFGNVQSGKTGQMFGIISKATDLGFPVFVLLTTDNVVLQQQTLDRVKADLDGYCICGENDARIFTDNCLLQPTIIVLKKNARILKLSPMSALVAPQPIPPGPQNNSPNLYIIIMPSFLLIDLLVLVLKNVIPRLKILYFQNNHFEN